MYWPILGLVCGIHKKYTVMGCLFPEIWQTLSVLFPRKSVSTYSVIQKSLKYKYKRSKKSHVVVQSELFNKVLCNKQLSIVLSYLIRTSFYFSVELKTFSAKFTVEKSLNKIRGPEFGQRGHALLPQQPLYSQK